MEQKKHRRGKKAGSRGFYIALGLCALAAAAAGYLLLSGSGEKKEDGQEAVQSLANVPTIVMNPQSEEEQEPVQMPESDPPPQQTQPEPVREPEKLQVVSPLAGDTVAAFSMEELQYNETTADWRTHDGIDIAAEAGTAVAAACAGTVLSVEYDDLMGTTVVLSHAKGYQTTYASLQEEVRVAVGDYVSAGSVIGTVGNTTLIESQQGAHLHFSVSCGGEPVDPAAFLALS